MNKLSKKLATLFLGAVTALGIGLLGSNVDKKGVKAADRVLTYTTTSATAFSEVGDTGNEFSASVSGTHAWNMTRFQLTSGKNCTITITDFSQYVVTQVTLGMSSNKTSGSGYVNIKNGSTQVANKGGSGTGFNTWNDLKVWEWTELAASPTTPVTFSGLSLTGNSLVIEIVSSANSIWIKTIEITFHEAGPAVPAEVTTAINAINAIGTVTLSSGAAILAAEAAYDAVLPADKALVTNYATLTAARSAYDALVEANATNVANTFIGKVNTLHGKTIVVGDKAELEILEAEYLTFTGTVKTLVDAADVAAKLADVRVRYEAAVVAADQAAADVVIDLINDLPATGDLVVGDIAQVNGAKAAFDALTDEQKALIGQAIVDKLTAAVNKIKEFEPQTGTISEVFQKSGWELGGGATTSGSDQYQLLAANSDFIMNKTLFTSDGVNKLITNDSITFTLKVGSYGGATTATAVVAVVDANGAVLASGSMAIASFTDTSGNKTCVVTVDITNVEDKTLISGLKISTSALQSGRRLRLYGVEATYNYFEIAEQEDIDVTGVTLSPDTMNLEVGETENLIVDIAPANATNKDYSLISSKPLVATVAQDGKVTAVGVGTATITVTTEDGDFEDTCEVIVVEGPSLKHTITGGFPNGSEFEVGFGGVELDVSMGAGITSTGTTGAFGAQIGKSDSNGEITFITKLSFDADEFDSVVVAASKSTAGGTATLKVMIGSNQIGETVTLTQTSTEYTFTDAQAKGMKKAAGDNAGHLAIIAEVANTGFQMKEFAIYGGAAQIAAAQSAALVELIDEMNSLDTCDDFDMAPLLREMYDELTQDEKDLFALQTYIADGGVEDTLMNKLVHMEYRNDLAEAEAGGSPILSVINDTNTLVIMIIAILGLSALAGYCLLEKKRLAA